MAAASAIGHVARTDPPVSQCNTGPVQCCNSVQSASAPALVSLLALLGIAVADQVRVGVTCSPISVIGLPGNACSAQPVCCTNNSFNGIVALGCVAVNINL
ncbi:fungal hydrophobin [Coprinellus micaceus]|uniref:Hydrophobin n=1 Tax=Coprinellus micaceus TaxID=71717 RepID=A0A4Y7SE96_COPMI|nr:fungal hydrophobin [Coprinellus micaceus]